MSKFKRERSDNKSISVYGNVDFISTAPTKSYPSNDYGLYDMAGNVSEWVQDVYRPLSFQDVNDFNPFRGNLYTTILRDENGNPLPKDSLGRLPMSIDTFNFDNPDKRGVNDPEEDYM